MAQRNMPLATSRQTSLTQTHSRSHLHSRGFTNTHSLKTSLLALSAFILYFNSIQLVAADQAPKELWEGVVYQKNVLNDKGFAYHQMTVTSYMFDGSQALAVKVLPEQYGSDPDLFISTNITTPNSTINSQYYCMKDGADTCLIERTALSVGLVLYIGVRCINPCEYTLATSYAPTIAMPNDNQTQLRLDGYSSTILTYTIPTTNPDGITRAVEFKIKGETNYDAIDLYFSLDSRIYQVEERKVENLLDSGVGYIFTSDDFGWCTGCTVFLLVDVINDGRYYATFKATTRSKTITTLGTEQMINPRQQECVLYYILTAANDLFINVNSYQGVQDLYVTGSSAPRDNTDGNILLMAARVPQRTLVITAEDRQRWGFTTGVLNICSYAFSQSSIFINPVEDNAGGRFDATDKVTYTFNIEKNSSTYFRFTQSTLAQNGFITVTATTYGLSANQLPARIFYKLCRFSDPTACSLNATEQRGQGIPELSVAASLASVNITRSGTTRNASFFHNASTCPDRNKCYYLINVFFADQNGPKKIDFQVSFNTSYYQPVTLSQSFKNIMKQGDYFYYALLPGSSDSFAFLRSLTIKLVSEIGDADLVVSVVDENPEIDQNQFEARGTDTYDSISLNNTGNFSLGRPLYIGVYAETKCVYRLSFEPVFVLDYNAKLVSATPIQDSVAYYNVYMAENQQTFYSFRPWWAGYEKRSMIFFANVIFNKIFFHIRPNDYPMWYLDDYVDRNDIIVINPTDKSYSLDNGYYIRIRPDFGLQDLISERQYIYYFYAFTQVQSDRFIELQLNELKFGYANTSSVFYRHFIVENNATYRFSVIPIIGNPAILLKLSNVEVQPRTADPWSWDYKTDNPGRATDSIDVTYLDRSSRNASCAQAGFNLNAGNRSCGFYVAVECQAYDCIYNITVQIVGRENQRLPKYLIEDDYYTGSVGYLEYSYFYFPISAQLGEMVIFLNKTADLGKNGDSVLIANVMPESQSKAISNWAYPTITNNNYTFGSANGRSNQAEILELCSQVVQSKCNSTSCVLIIGVLGITANTQSRFRLKVYTQGNKLYDRNPIVDSIAVSGSYKYYWFTSNSSFINPRAAWQYQVTVAPTVLGSEVDLYVSILDGRYPVAEDYDFASENMGADSLFINSTDPFFDDTGYNRSNGILFIVGVRALTDKAAYTLQMTGPSQTLVSQISLTTGLYVSNTLQGNNVNNRIHYYKWYNWGQKDFRFNIEVQSGNVTVYLNYISEEIFLNNGFQALPLNQNNSIWTVYLNATQAGVLTVSKSSYGANKLFCYYCWYYVTVTTNFTTTASNYRLSFNAVPDTGENVDIIALNTSVSQTLPAISVAKQMKFLLDSKDPVTITARVTTGFLNMFVGLYPDQSANYQYFASGSSTLTINIKQTDDQFKLGAWYYITIQAGQGRTVLTLSVNQRKTTTQLFSGVTLKDKYFNALERVKFYYFLAPTYRTPQFRATINIQSLTPGFYPTVLVYKSVFTAARDPTLLQYPNPQLFNYSFGDNFFQIANYNNFTYSLTDVGGAFTYYAIAIYSFSYGMTDLRKPQFKITMTISNTTLAFANPSTYDVFSRFKALPQDADNDEHSELSSNSQAKTDFTATIDDIDDWQDDEGQVRDHKDHDKHVGHSKAKEFFESIQQKISSAVHQITDIKKQVLI